MFCPQCGAEVEEGTPVCASCGAQLIGLKPVEPSVKKPKKRRRPPCLLILVGLLLLLLLLAAGGLWVYLRFWPVEGQLAFLREEEGKVSLWLADEDGSNPRAIIRGVDEIFFPFDPVTYRPNPFSPDGRHLLFKVKEKDGFSLFLADALSERLMPLVEGQPDVWGAFSPNGRKVLVAIQGADGARSLFVIDTRGEERIGLVAKVDSAWASFSPNSRRLLISVTDEGQTGLYITDVDGENRIDLVSDVYDAWAQFSPKGDRLLLWVKEEKDKPGTLFVTDLKGEKRHEVVTADSAWAVFMPGDGRIWVQLARAGRHSMGVVDAQGNYQTEVLGGAADVRLKPVSNGSRLAFAARGGKGWDLYTVKVDGTHLVELTSGADKLDWRLSPSGRWLAYLCMEKDKFMLYLATADNQQSETLFSAADKVWNFDFSPDEKWIAYDVEQSREEGKEKAIYVLNLDEMIRSKLVEGGYFPVWGEKSIQMPWELLLGGAK